MPSPAPSASALSSAELRELRAHFPLLATTTYLNSCSLGALPDTARAELAGFLDRWDARGAAAWYEEWMAKLDEMRTLAGALHGARTRETALLPSTSAALSVVAESVPERLRAEGRNRVVVAELDFPTLPYQWMVKPGIEVVRVPSPDGVGIPAEAWERHVDERTLFVATSHVFYATGFVQEIDRIAEVARQAGALSLIDGYQASGQIPVDVRAAGVDIYTSGPLKWLCGGPGLAWLFVREELVERMEPRITSWFAAERQFEFDAGAFEYRSDARRFELGTPSLPSVHLALGALRLLGEVGWDRIHARIRTLGSRLVQALEEAGFQLSIAGDPARRSGIVMIRHEDPEGAVGALEERGFVVDHRPGHVRVSPHVYNTEAEVDRFVDAFAEVSGRGISG